MTIPKKDIIYVLLQFALFFAWLWDVETMKFELSENLRWLALIIAGIGFFLALVALLQLNTKISPFPSPAKGAKLVTSGAFAFARHPIYAGILFIAFGMAVWLGSGYKLLISVGFFVLFLLKTTYEEKQLEQVFDKYAEYKSQTGRFFPKFKGRI